LMSKISRTVRGGEEVARNVRKGCRTLDEEDMVTCPANPMRLDLIIMLTFCEERNLQRSSLYGEPG
jgi:hypothetical protein